MNRGVPSFLAAALALFLVLGAPSSASAAEFTSLGYGVSGVTGVLQLTPAEHFTGNIYCFFVFAGASTIGPISVNGSPGGCREAAFHANPDGTFVVTVPGFNFGPNLQIRATRNGVVVAARSTDTATPPPPPPPPPGSRTLRVRAAIWGGADFGQFEPADGASVPTTARIPLGSRVMFQAIDSDGQPVPAAFALAAPTLLGAIDPKALFSGAVLHRWGFSVPTHQLHVQGVHLGQVTLTITPSDTTLASSTVAVQVVPPSRISALPSELDEDVVEVAHRTGVPPQFIRAHINKETGSHNRMSYRYEPIGPDFGEVVWASRGRNSRVQPTFEDYRLEFVADALSQIAHLQGELTTDDDINPRATLRINCQPDGSGGNQIGTQTAQGEPANPLAWEIFRCNDATMPGRQNWSSAAGDSAAKRIAALKAASPFTAQTTIAASYGLLQVLFGEAIARGWVTNDGRQNPNLLFDRPGGVQRNEGSLIVGSQKVRDELLERLNATEGTIVTPADLLRAFTRAWQAYNNGQKGYGADVANRLANLEPALDAPIIQP